MTRNNGLTPCSPVQIHKVSQQHTASIFSVIFCSLYSTGRNKAVIHYQRLEQQMYYFKLRKGQRDTPIQFPTRDKVSRVPSIEEPFFWTAAPALHAC